MPARSHLGFFLLSRIVLRARATHLLASPHWNSWFLRIKMLFPGAELADYSLPLKLVLETRPNLSESDALIRVIVTRKLARLEVIVQLFHLFLKLPHAIA